MSAENNSTAEKIRPRIRYEFPIIVLVIAAIVYYFITTWPDKDVQGMTLNTAKTITFTTVLFVLWLWAVFFSGWRKLNTLGSTTILGLIFIGLFQVRCDGDFQPLVRLKPWVQNLVKIQPADQLEANRAQQKNKPGINKAIVQLQPTDFPDYRGIGRSGQVPEQAIPLDWEKNPPKVDWKQPIGEGYAGYVVVNHFLFTIEQRRDEEALVCYDGRDGSEVWLAKWKTRFDEQMGGPGPRATPTFYDGKIYAIGATGHLVCADATNGDILWQKETLENNANLQWAMCGSPLVDDQQVIVTPGSQLDSAKGSAIQAYQRLTGDLLWKNGNYAAGYSSPQYSTIGGMKQLLNFDANGLAGMDPTSGKELWRFRWDTMQGINVAQPLVWDDGRIFISSGYGVGGAMLRVQLTKGEWKVEQVWRTKATVMRSKFSNPVRLGDQIYGLNDGILECIDVETGKRVWKDDRRARKGEGFGHGQILLVKNVIVALTEYGELVAVEATPEEFREKGRLWILEGDKTWNNFAIADGVIYIRNDREMARISFPSLAKLN